MNKFSKGVAAKINKINKVKDLVTYKSMMSDISNNDVSFSNFIKNCKNSNKTCSLQKKECKFK